MIELKTVVENAQGRRGVVVSDLLGCCSDDETPVVYDKESGFMGTMTSDLRIIGPENAVPEPKRCGMGKGHECCIFLVVGANGFECERFGSLRYTLIFRKDDMNAQREPTELFPGCMTVRP